MKCILLSIKLRFIPAGINPLLHLPVRYLISTYFIWLVMLLLSCCREQGDNQRIVHDLTAELRRVVKKHSNDAGLLPMEHSYLNRTAFLTAAPQQVNTLAHTVCRHCGSLCCLSLRQLLLSLWQL